MNWHLVSDLLAATSAFAMTVLVYRWRLEGAKQEPVAAFGTGYAVALVLGAVLGGYGLGTLNLVLSGSPGVGRSIIGALAGTIASVEIYKRFRSISGSTGLIFVAGFSTTVIVGRIGCLLSGIEDQTYGIATGASWGWDFGDGEMRHPVQLYESAAMALFLTGTWLALAVRSPIFLRNGFYLMVGFYAAQRFIWEFLKPYEMIAGPLNLFHFVCLGLFCYAVYMIVRSRNV